MLGIVVIDKPAGITSHDVVNRVRRVFGTRRVGHAGTLDPLATGVLVLAVGPATRALPYLDLEPKIYIAQARFGQETDTQDSEGKVIAEGALPDDLSSAIGTVLPSMIGEQQQIPPAYSAVKRNGKPLYKYARAGEVVAVEPRQVAIQQFVLLDCHAPQAKFEIECSGGTYVRTLIHDLGKTMGCGAHMTGLQRIRVGAFDLAMAASLDTLSSENLIPLREALRPTLKSVSLQPKEETSVLHGNPIPTSESGTVALIDGDDEVLAIARAESGWAQPICVLRQGDSAQV